MLRVFGFSRFPFNGFNTGISHSCVAWIVGYFTIKPPFQLPWNRPLLTGTTFIDAGHTRVSSITVSSLRSVSFGIWSIQRDSNPSCLIGSQGCYRYTMDAYCRLASIGLSIIVEFRRFLSIFVDCNKNSQNSFLSWLPLFSYARRPISWIISLIFSRSSRVSALDIMSCSSSFSLVMQSCRETFISLLLSGLRVVL